MSCSPINFSVTIILQGPLILYDVLLSFSNNGVSVNLCKSVTVWSFVNYRYRYVDGSGR